MHMYEIGVPREKPTRGNQTSLIPYSDYGQHVNAVIRLLHTIYSGYKLSENLLRAEISGHIDKHWTYHSRRLDSSVCVG